MGDKQTQTVSDGSVAIQVKGDFNYSGLTYRDVKEICVELIEKNFPVLREEARIISMEYVEEFGKKFFDRLKQEDLEKTQERLKSPDIQAAISSSVIHVARMTEKSHQEILCELLTEKINETEDEKNLILNDSIEIMTKITKNQVLFLVLVYALRSLTKSKIQGDTIVRHPDNSVHYNFYENEVPDLIGNEVYPIDSFLLAHKGLVRAQTFVKYEISLTQLLKDRTGIDLPEYQENQKIEDGDEFSKNFPKLSRLLRQFNFDKLADFDSLPITPIADEIGKAYLKNVGFIS